MSICSPFFGRGGQPARRGAWQKQKEMNMDMGVSSQQSDPPAVRGTSSYIPQRPPLHLWWADSAMNQTHWNVYLSLSEGQVNIQEKLREREIITYPSQVSAMVRMQLVSSKAVGWWSH